MLQLSRHRTLRLPMLTASMSFLLLALAACGSDSKSSSTTAAGAGTVAPAATTAAPAAATTAAPAATTTAAAATTTAAAATTTAGAAASGTPVAVKESEFKIDLPSKTFTAGAYTFNITNGGQFKHDIIVVASDGTTVKSDILNPGATGTLNVDLKAGTYEVYCGVPTHKGKGMDLTITVT